jgi:hypothetical protein
VRHPRPSVLSCCGTVLYLSGSNERGHVSQLPTNRLGNARYSARSGGCRVAPPDFATPNSPQRSVLPEAAVLRLATSCTPQRRRAAGPTWSELHGAPAHPAILAGSCPSNCPCQGIYSPTECSNFSTGAAVELSGLEPLTSCMPVSLGMSVPGITAGTGQGRCLGAPGDSLPA